MKILFFQGAHPDDKIGGAELQSWLLAKQFASDHCAFYLATKSNVHEFEEVRKDGVTILKLPSKKKISPPDIFQIIKVIKRYRPDVIHLRFFDYISLNLIIHFVFKHKLFYHVSSDKNCWYFPKTPKKNVTHFLNRLSLYFYNGIIFQTEQQRNMFKPKPYRSITVSNSFDDSIPIEVKKDEHKNKDIMVLWVNNIKKNKNPEAFIQLSEMCIGNDYRFVMIGYPDNIGVSTSIKQKEKTLSNFQYIPGIPYDSILKYFFKASVFIITSFQEGFPNVIIQAMKTQTPIISLYVDPDNCFSQKGTGILSYNINQMKKDLDYIIENKDMYKRIQRKQFHYANKNFELKRNFTKLNMFLS